MSVAIWPEHGNWMCDWGPLEHTCARFDQDPIEVGPTMLTTEIYALKLYMFGPTEWGGSVNTVEITDDDRVFWHSDARGQRWTWELFPAHFTDNPARALMIGRWPD